MTDGNGNAGDGDEWLGALVVQVAALDASYNDFGVVPRLIVLPEKKQRSQLFVAGVTAGMHNVLPASIMESWPANSAMKASRVPTIEKAFAIIKRDALSPGRRVQLERLGPAQVVEVTGNGAVVKVRTGEGTESTLHDLPGGLASLLRMLSEPWLKGLVAREKARRANGGPSTPVVPPVTEEPSAAGILAAGTSAALREVIERATRDMLRADLRVDLSGPGDDLFRLASPLAAAYEAATGPAAIERRVRELSEGREWSPAS